MADLVAADDPKAAAALAKEVPAAVVSEVADADKADPVEWEGRVDLIRRGSLPAG